MRVAFVVAPGQSNEQGVSGTEYGQSRTWNGYPYLDAAGSRSMWPRVSSRLGDAGVLSVFHKAAVGATGMCAYWVGLCRTWQSGMFVNVGSYALSGGKLWKCTDANTTNTDPYGVSTIEPSASVGADNIQWSDLGAPTAEDVNGAIYSRTSARFDPNGALSAARTRILSLPADRRFAIVSIGQSDKSAGMTLAQYTEAYRQVVNYWLESGVEVFAGLTVIGRTSGLPEWMRDVGDPAWAAICAEFSGREGFHVGANLYRHFGGVDPFTSNLTVAVAPALGLLADQLHMNSIAYDSAADEWATTILSEI